MSESPLSGNLILKRGLTVFEAAEYCGLSVSGFRHWVSTGKIVCKIEGTNRYDLKALDKELDRLSGFKAEQTAETGIKDYVEAYFSKVA